MDYILARTKPCCEAMAQRQIARERPDHPTYLPYIHDKRCHRKAPMFPSYLFIGEESYHFVINIPAISFVYNYTDSQGEKRPHLLSSRVISRWKMQEENGLVILPPPQFNKGEEVNHNNVPAIYEGMSGNERAQILISLLGFEKRIKVPIRELTRRAA